MSFYSCDREVEVIFGQVIFIHECLSLSSLCSRTPETTKYGSLNNLFRQSMQTLVVALDFDAQITKPSKRGDIPISLQSDAQHGERDETTAVRCKTQGVGFVDLGRQRLLASSKLGKSRGSRNNVLVRECF